MRIVCGKCGSDRVQPKWNLHGRELMCRNCGNIAEEGVPARFGFKIEGDDEVKNPKEPYISMGKRIKEVRKALKLTQIELGAAMGFNQYAVSNAEVGNWEVGGFYDRLVERFNVNRHWLETGEGEMFVDKKLDIPTHAPNIEKEAPDMRDPDIQIENQLPMAEEDPDLQPAPTIKPLLEATEISYYECRGDRTFGMRAKVNGDYDEAYCAVVEEVQAKLDNELDILMERKAELRESVTKLEGREKALLVRVAALEDILSERVA